MGDLRLEPETAIGADPLEGYRKTEIGPLPEEWDVTRLEDLAKVRYGKAKPKDLGEVPAVGESITIFRDVVETLAYLAQIIAVGALIYAAYAFLLQRKQLNFDVITNCTERFQTILPGLYSDDAEKREEAKAQYVDLCNEQLFYFTNGYLPPEVIEEWLDGMVLYLPHHNGEEWYQKSGPDYEPHRIGPKFLKRYSRIKEFFTVEGCYDVGNPEERTDLVRQIYEKVMSRANERRGFLWRMAMASEIRQRLSS